MSLSKSLYTVSVFIKINTKRFFRDRTAIFFTIGFPLIFLFVFGSLNSGSSNVSLHVAILNNSQSSFSKTFVSQITHDKVFKVDTTVHTLAEAQNKLANSQLDAAIILPPSFGSVKPGTHYPSGQAQVVYTQNEAQSAQALTSILSTQFADINAKLAPSPKPFTVTSKELNQQSLTAFDYTFAGLIGFAIIGMGIFGPMNVFPELKKQGILRRLSTTPLKVWQYFLSTMVGQALIGLVSLAIMFIVSILVFHLRVVGNWVELGLFIVFGIMTILGIGLALGGWAKNERQVAPLANIIVFPLMFLSGTFFPRYLMPEWLQNISTFLPLTPIIDGIRLIATEGKTFLDIAPQLGLTAAWFIVIYAIAFRVFRWE